MNWHVLRGGGGTETCAAEMAEGVLIRESLWSAEDSSVALCFIPNSRIVDGCCSERAKVVRRTGTK